MMIELTAILVALSSTKEVSEHVRAILENCKTSAEQAGALIEMIRARADAMSDRADTAAGRGRDPAAELLRILPCEQDKNMAVNQGAQVIAVVSGKGGVGKSTIALGLWEYFTNEGPTLLVDFDMHNRGLTSLLRAKEARGESMLSLMKAFHEGYANFPLKGMGSAGEADSQFATLRDKIIGYPGRKGVIRPLGLHMPPAGTAPLAAAAAPALAIQPGNAAFLCSVPQGERFLGSSVFGMDQTEVFYFLRVLAYWASCPVAQQAHPPCRRIIIDCHGAHDLFMVGAILASSRIVMVSTADIGSLEGSLDLFEYARTLTNAYASGPAGGAVVINSRMPGMESVSEELKKLYSTRGGDNWDAFEIAHSRKISNIAMNYTFGDVSQTREIWPMIAELAAKLAAPVAAPARPEPGPEPESEVAAP
jgi:MinD-like ATPase involved in chromosome partitioning or flagellar assembly